MPGNDWTAEEMAVWQQQCLEFLQEGAVKDKRLSKAKKAKTAADVEHVASYDESLSWHNAVLMLTGEGLCQFLHEQLCEFRKRKQDWLDASRAHAGCVISMRKICCGK